MIEEKIPLEISLWEKEELKMILRRKFVSVFARGFLILLIIFLIIGVIVFSFTLDITEFLLTWFIPLSIGVFLLCIIGYPYTNGHKYIITNQRIIIYKKFVTISTRDIQLINLTDLILNVSLFGRIFNYGTIMPVSAGMEAKIGLGLFYEIIGISNSVSVHNEILKYKRDVVAEKEITIFKEYEAELEEPIIPYVKLFPEEKIYSVLKRTYWSFFFKIVWLFIIFVALFILFSYEYAITELKYLEQEKLDLILSLIKNYPYFTPKQFNGWIIPWIIFGILTIIFACVLGCGIPYVRSHRYYITSRRLMMFKKYVFITYRQVFYEKITDIVVQKGPIARALNYGGLRPITAGMEFGVGSSLFSIAGIRDINEVRNKIMNIKSRYPQETY